ncbi:type II toxin-antitoxin system VapB family antitoxin [Streptomyces sp. 11x1]|uniref:type II toxin-antitoxin system VapB family antitoxin n=1 Tax=Streptomyces sp. 11x1 TaxID=3038642 RepID=UPI00292F9217|nr:type II toxin-antitoxin system VapB family antitoxin [Streptomyces sp. 11x1]WNZ11628.1 type II toxin-antitoxin system VapB family antitoxin [Streptomyces sp. 11x1]
MSVTQIDLDDEALAEAMRLMGATTKKETVNAALRDYVARIKRLEAAEKLAARGARGEFEQASSARDAQKRVRRAAFE